ncbi:hypothetical protein C900_04293 [Fulvivirga imtechensis AK7]|uniref:N-acetyltransferase domain-containing protein n=1 Tax=Fulvivirga imtechensis AK7 TaxID=1237149 RepID=L8JWL3_9BACT|nr:N-acetyltransferase [Fulvivirga imtechensis]ELR73441.1 hypothetical protein C900_04293 [Fulvivirga imtechensis AK7]
MISEVQEISECVEEKAENIYHTIEVDSRPLEKRFYKIPETIYRNDPDWIPFVREDIAAIFDPRKNPYFKHGNAARWILTTPSGKEAGRIAAFINFNKMYDGNKKVGGIGFFECINDKNAAFTLFNIAVKWLKVHYFVEAVDGPINFGENDKFWGLLIKGFTPASYGMNYNPPYYQELFEAYGFNILYRQITNSLDFSRPLPQRFVRIAQRVASNDHYSFKPFRYRAREQFVADFVEIYNKAWVSFKDFHSMDADVVRKSISEMKPIMEEDFIWFAYAGKSPTGLLVALPDVNEVIKYSGPAFNWWGKLKFLFYKKIKGFSCARVIVMGIVPEFQHHGLESALIYHAFNEGKKRPQYKHVQLAWVGDFNDKMIAIHKAMGAVEDKQHATFRKMV